MRKLGSAALIALGYMLLALTSVEQSAKAEFQPPRPLSGKPGLSLKIEPPLSAPPAEKTASDPIPPLPQKDSEPEIIELKPYQPGTETVPATQEDISDLLLYLEAAPELSPETKELLRKIKRQVPSIQTQLQLAEPVTIEREKKGIALPSREDFESYKSDVGLEVSVRKMDTSGEKLLQEAYNALSLGQTESAISLYRQVIEKDPGNQQAIFGLGAAYQKAGQHDQAREAYTKLLKKNPKHKEGLNNFLVLLGEEAPMEALAEFQKLEAENPNFAPVLAQIGMIQLSQKNYPEAIEYLSKAASLEPKNASYRYNLAVAFDRAGQYPNAIALYRELIQNATNGQSTPEPVQKLQDRVQFLMSNLSAHPAVQP